MPQLCSHLTCIFQPASCHVSDRDQRARRQRRQCTGKPILRWWLRDGVLFCSTVPVWSREASDHVYQLAYVLSLLDRLHLRAGQREHSNLQIMILPSPISRSYYRHPSFKATGDGHARWSTPIFLYGCLACSASPNPCLVASSSMNRCIKVRGTQSWLSSCSCLQDIRCCECPAEDSRHNPSIISSSRHSSNHAYPPCPFLLAAAIISISTHTLSHSRSRLPSSVSSC